MGLLKHLRSRSRFKSQQELHPYPNYRARDLLNELSNTTLQLIFSIVAPHTLDDTYEVSERSLIRSACILCDLRDLSSCVQVSRKWQRVAEILLYRSVRIDAVHYCPLEETLSSQRRRKHLDPLQVPATRLHLFQRTLRAAPELACLVFCLKLPYTTRETCKADLSRVVCLLPNLRYIDLPEGFYCADISCQILRESLQANCPEIRKMTFERGSEEALISFGRSRWWINLEILHLCHVNVEILMLRHTLSQLPVLKRLHISQAAQLDDSVFLLATGIPEFPALEQLHLDSTPNITGIGLEKYLSRVEVTEVLNFLSLSKTGVSITWLPSIVRKAINLAHLSYSEIVSQSLPLEPIPPLTSRSLRTLNFEIISSNAKANEQYSQGPAATYYPYLAASLKANGLPLLRKVYVRESKFPEQLLVAPAPKFDLSTRAKNNETVNQPLEIYTKGDDELDWVYSSFQPLPSTHFRHQDRASSDLKIELGRPVSAYNVSRGLGPQWSGEARQSIMMGNGNGAFLAIPTASSAFTREGGKPDTATLTRR